MPTPRAEEVLHSRRDGEIHPASNAARRDRDCVPRNKFIFISLILGRTLSNSFFPSLLMPTIRAEELKHIRRDGEIHPTSNAGRRDCVLSEEQWLGGARYGGKIGENAYFRIYGKYFDRDDQEGDGRCRPVACLAGGILAVS